MFIFTVLLALACVACDAEDTGLKGVVGNEDTSLTNLDVTWTEVGTTEAQGLLTLGDSVATVVAVNLGRKGDQSGNYSILQLRINPVEVPTEALERNDYLLPLDLLLKPTGRRDSHRQRPCCRNVGNYRNLRASTGRRGR